MAVKTLGYILDRLKFTLASDTCGLCHALLRKDVDTQTICPTCERRYMLRQPVPVMTLLAGPMYAACEFPYALKRLIYGLKFQKKNQNGMPLSEVLIHYWNRLPESQFRNWIVVPIPPHRHSASGHVPLIARPFASHCGYSFVDDGLIWQRDVCSQHTVLNKRKRRENIAGAFQVNPKLLKRLKPDSRILVVDDIMTTGSTLVEALSTFKRANPEMTLCALSVSHVPLAVTRFQFNNN